MSSLREVAYLMLSFDPSLETKIVSDIEKLLKSYVMSQDLSTNSCNIKIKLSIETLSHNELKYEGQIATIIND
jgi:hypothetical protein